MASRPAIELVQPGPVHGPVGNHGWPPKGSCVASPGNVAVAASEKHASVMVVAAPPLVAASDPFKKMTIACHNSVRGALGCIG